MPFENRFEHEGAGVVARITGSVTYPQMRAAFDSIWKSPDAARIRYRILDIADDARLEVGADDLRKVGLLVPEAMRQSAEVRIAIVTGNAVMVGMVRLAMVYSHVWGKSSRVRHFWTIGEAREWIAQECADLFGQGGETHEDAGA